MKSIEYYFLIIFLYYLKLISINEPQIEPYLFKERNLSDWKSICFTCYHSSKSLEFPILISDPYFPELKYCMKCTFYQIHIQNFK